MKRKNKLLIVLIIIIFLLGLWFLPGLRYYPGITAVTMDALVKQKVPLGTNQAAVIDFLEGEEIEYSFVESENKIYAIKRDTCVGILIECSIDMIFEFNEKGILISSVVKEGLTGL